MKNKTKHLLVLAALAVMVGFCTSNVSAQNREEARQRMMDGYRTSLEVKAEDDWKKIEPLITKVLDARRATGFGGGGFGGGGGRQRGGGDNADQNNNNRNRGGGQPNPEREALQKAVEDKAPVEEVKEKLAKYRESRKAREATAQAALEAAQGDLRKALSPRQEAGAVLAGLLR
jgi:hypothetical protein